MRDMTRVPKTQVQCGRMHGLSTGIHSHRATASQVLTWSCCPHGLGRFFPPTRITCSC